MPNGPASTSPRRPWMATAIWGWRLELFLTVGSLIVLAISARISSCRPVHRGGACRPLHFTCVPKFDANCSHHMRTNRDHRRLHAALWHCAIIGRNGSIPKVIRSASLPVGRRYLLRLAHRASRRAAAEVGVGTGRRTRCSRSARQGLSRQRRVRRTRRHSIKRLSEDARLPSRPSTRDVTLGAALLWGRSGRSGSLDWPSRAQLADRRRTGFWKVGGAFDHRRGSCPGSVRATHAARRQTRGAHRVVRRGR